MKRLTPISQADARDLHGIVAVHSRAEDGELRFRLVKSDGTEYVRTEAAPDGAWQDAHSHENVQETYIVQTGWIGYAELNDGDIAIRIYREGDVFTAPSSVIHNIYMPKGAVIHTIKHGNVAKEIRIADAGFTKRTGLLTETDVLRLDGKHPVRQ